LPISASIAEMSQELVVIEVAREEPRSEASGAAQSQRAAARGHQRCRCRHCAGGSASAAQVRQALLVRSQGRCLGGIILSSEAFIAEHIHNFMRQTGPSLSPFNAWVLLKGLETLGVRVRAQTENAAKIAEALASLVIAPSMKTMVSFALLVVILALRPQGLMGKRMA
jgi:hypothetical protein